MTIHHKTNCLLKTLYSDMVCSVAGITSDANVLTNELRLIGQRYMFQYGESIPCEQLVSWLCDVKQAYTQYGGMYSTFKFFIKPLFIATVIYNQAKDHLVYQYYTWAGTDIMAINCINLILVVITVDGRLLALVTTVQYVF